MASSACKVSPTQALPYFMELVLVNQVRTKESEEAIRKAEKKRRAEEAAAKIAAEAAAAKEQEQKRQRELDAQGDDEELAEVSTPTDESGGDGGFRSFRRAPTAGSSSSSELPAGDIAGKVKQLQVSNAQAFYLLKGEGRRGGVANVTVGITDSMHRRFSRTAWRQAIDNLEPEYRLPALILKKHVFVKEEGPTRLGPGTYDPDYRELEDKKRNATTPGIMSSCSLRFPKEKEAADIPGPGAYGIPHEALHRAEEKYKHPGKVTLFASGPCDVRGAGKKAGGSGLPPGYYEHKSSITDLLNKVTSLRGPYDLYTPDRLIIPYGYYKSPKVNPVGPGQYNVRKSLKQEMNCRANNYKGVLSPYPRDRRLTGERIVLVAPLWPLETGENPGPGQYDPQPFHRLHKQSKYPFGSSTTEVRAAENQGDYDMAPNRYNPERGRKYCPLGCGHRSAFRSKTTRLDLLKIQVLTERLRGKDVPKEEKIAWNTR